MWIFTTLCRHPEEAVFVDEIEQLQNEISAPEGAYPFFIAVHGSLTVDDIVKNAGGDIRGHHVYMCGPLPMVQAFEKKFVEDGVPAGEYPFRGIQFQVARFVGRFPTRHRRILMQISFSKQQGNVPVTVMQLMGDIDSSTYTDVIDKAQEAFDEGAREPV